MQTDNILCLGCLLLLLCYILENVKIQRVSKKNKVLNKKNIDNKIISISNFFKKINKNKYNLIIPREFGKNKIVSSEKKRFFKKFIHLIIHKLVKKINTINNNSFTLKPPIHLIVYDHNNIYNIISNFYLINKNYVLKIKLNIIYVSRNEYYIVNISLIDTKKKIISNMFRKSKFYNKWIINV